jgi:hypothetical protein
MMQAVAEILVRYVLPHTLQWLSNLKRSFNDLRGVGFSLLKGCLPFGGWPFCFASGKRAYNLLSHAKAQRRKGARKDYL